MKDLKEFEIPCEDCYYYEVVGSGTLNGNVIYHKSCNRILLGESCDGFTWKNYIGKTEGYILNKSW